MNDRRAAVQRVVAILRDAVCRILCVLVRIGNRCHAPHRIVDGIHIIDVAASVGSRLRLNDTAETIEHGFARDIRAAGFRGTGGDVPRRIG